MPKITGETGPPPPPQPHLNAGENLLEGGRLVSPGGQQLSSSLKVLDILTVHLQEGSQFLDHITDAGGDWPTGRASRCCPQPEDPDAKLPAPPQTAFLLHFWMQAMGDVSSSHTCVGFTPLRL